MLGQDVGDVDVAGRDELLGLLGDVDLGGADGLVEVLLAGLLDGLELVVAEVDGAVGEVGLGRMGEWVVTFWSLEWDWLRMEGRVVWWAWRESATFLERLEVWCLISRFILSSW